MELHSLHTDLFQHTLRKISLFFLGNKIDLREYKKTLIGNLKDSQFKHTKIDKVSLGMMVLFYLPIAVSIVFILSVKIYPTVDGPAHLYNSQIIKELLFNKSTPFNSYYEFNKVLVPNWLDHFILAFFSTFVPLLWVQKLILVLIILGQALIFNKIILKINPANKLLSVLVLPFIFSDFFHEGFYNQQLSFLLLFIFIYWRLCNQVVNNDSSMYYWMLFMFSILFWFSNIVTYVLFGLMVGLEILIKEWKLKSSLIAVVKRYWRLIIVFLPTLYLSLIFVFSTKMVTTEKSINLANKFILLFRLDPIIIFDTPGESRLTIPIAIILLLLLIFGLNKSGSNKSMLGVIKICALFLFISFWLLPNEAGAGMLSYRFATLFYLMLIILIAEKNLKISIIIPAAVLITSIQLGLTFKRHNGTIRDYAQISQNYYEIGQDLPKGATVWPISFNTNWFIGHSNNYLGINKSAINYENYEAYNPWFPIRFNENHRKINELYNELSTKKKLLNHYSIPANYVLVSGINKGNSFEVDAFIKKLYNPVLVSKSKDSSMWLVKIGEIVP